jgi:peptidoglycan/LPS O-acetylase OafA/YrhL
VRAAPSEAYIDGLRAVAILGVMGLHAWGIAGNPRVTLLGTDLTMMLARGGWGVDLFFVLSGFLLARPWFVAEARGAARPAFGPYFKRRLRRIVPAYYLSLVVLLALFLPSHNLDPATVEGPLGVLNIGAHLTFVHHLIPATSSEFRGLNGVYWTLTIEMTFYLVLPLVVPLFFGARRVLLTLIGAFIGTSLWIYLAMRSMGGVVDAMSRSVDGHTGKVLGVAPDQSSMRVLLLVQFPSWLFTFAIGITLARLVVRHRAGVLGHWLVPAPLASLGAPIAVIAMVLLARGYQQGPAIGHGAAVMPYVRDRVLTAALLGLAVYGFTFGSRWIRRPLEWLPLRFLGQISYGAYLYHLMIMISVARFTHMLDLGPTRVFWAAWAITLALTFPVASVSWYLIERPLLRNRQPGPTRRGDRRLRVRRRRAVVTGTVLLSAVALTLGIADPAGSASSVDGALGALRGVSSVAEFTGPATPASAALAGSIYPGERELLERCGAKSGASQGLSTATWGGAGSVFACTDPIAAKAYEAAMPQWEPSVGYRPTTVSGVPAGRVWFRQAPDGTPEYPFHFHIRYASGAQVIGVVISARSDSVGRSAVRKIFSAVHARYPAG